MTHATDTETRPAPVPVVSPGAVALRRARRNPGLMVASSVLLLFVLLAVFAPLLAPHDPYLQSLSGRMSPPVFMGGSWEHPLGTDALGRDYLSRILYGARVSLTIGITTALVSGLIGCTLGILAGYFGGRVDAVVTFLINVRLAMPAILVALAVVSIFGSSVIGVILILGFLLWDRFAVVLRSATKQVCSQEYVAAAKVMGTPVHRILTKDILPNVAGPIIVIGTIEIAHAILFEAALSFLGLGIKPPTPSWGLMIAEGREMLLFESWLITIPGVCLFVLILAINIFGDGLRDVTTPEGRN